MGSERNLPIFVPNGKEMGKHRDGMAWRMFPMCLAVCLA